MVPSHPTIVIGFGRYGLTVMRRLLGEGLDQGALVWDETSGHEGPGSRCLRNLAFIHVYDHEGDDSRLLGDLARDLYGQILDIKPEFHTSQPQAFRRMLAAAVVTARDRLLDASRRIAANDNLRIGLDVLILAQPTGPESIGRLDDLLEPAMEALADDRSLERPAPGSNLLNFLLFLDFDSYWESHEANSRIRVALNASVERWHSRQVAGGPGFARIYLMDGQVKDQGRRQEGLRIEEIVNLLCLMLFEGKRDDPGLRGLFEKPSDEIPPLATFGIRVLEWRQDLLGLLSAAKFAIGWLDYLSGNSAPSESAVQGLQGKLNSYRPDAKEYADERQELAELTADGLRRIEADAHSISMAAEGSGWREEYSQKLERTLTVLKARLSAWSGEFALRCTSNRLANFAGALNEIVSAAVDERHDPLPAGRIVQELLEVRSSLEIPAPAVPDPDNPGQWDSLARIHGNFAWFRESQLNPTNLQRLWPLLGTAAAAAWTPVVLDALQSVPAPDPDALTMLRKGYEFLMFFNNGAVVVFLLALFFWAAGGLWFEPQIRRWLARGFLGWSHPSQGLLSDRIVSSIRSGPVYQSVHAHADYVYDLAIQRVNAEVRREIDHVVGRLRTRILEMHWLRDQMREFLRTHGIDPDAPSLRMESGSQAAGSYTVSLDLAADLERTLALNPSNADRYRAAQAERCPLSRWHADYSDAFLYPVVFLEQLRQDYYDSRARTAAGAEMRAAALARAYEVERYLEKCGSFPLAFDWSTAQGAVPDLQSWCVVPREWRMDTAISTSLANYGYIDQRTVTGSAGDRAYFLKVQWGVSPERLSRFTSSAIVASPGGRNS